MKTYKIKCFNKGGLLIGSFNVEFDGSIGSKFKSYYLEFAKNFVFNKTYQIEVE